FCFPAWGCRTSQQLEESPLIGNLFSGRVIHIAGEATAGLATPFATEPLRQKKLGNRIELQETFPSPVSMEHFNRKLLQRKEKELATLDKRTSDRRSTLERELATLEGKLATVERGLATLDEEARLERKKL